MIFFKTTARITDKFLEKNYPEYKKMIYEFVIEDDISLSERIWLYQNNLHEKPKCLNCDNKVNFIKFYKGYRKYCCKKCAAEHTHKNLETKRARTDKMLSCNYDLEKRQLMTKKSNLTKSNFSETKKNDINNKRKITTLEKWGVDNISKNEDIKQKIVSINKEIIPLARLEKTKKCIENLNFKILNIDNENFTLICNKCLKEFMISRSLFMQRKRFDIDICLNCNPNNNNSDFENKVYEYIKNLPYNGDVINKYRGFKKYEIDIYLPDLKIGFECNGVYWHSEKYKENNYHINKTNFFKNLGIQIIHIWEDDWKYKKEIICSRINNILLLTPNRIYARKCIIKELTNKDSNDFLFKNHLQGMINSKVRLGLFYNNELASVMTFGNLRKNLGRNSSKGSYELLRFCNKLNTNVIGGASKLLHYFIENNNINDIISYASLDWSVGNLYEKLGFYFQYETKPNYYYFHKDNGMRLNRFNFRKDKLVADGYDKNLSEHDIMISRGYYRIYDTGSLLYKIDINKK